MSDDEFMARLVDREDLAEYLQSQLGPVDGFDVRHHGEGHSNETLFVNWGEHELVIRRPPPGETAETAHDVLREYRVIDALQETDVRVPPTVVASEDHSIMGCDFYVMEHVDGEVIRTTEPDIFANPSARQQVGEQLVDRLAEIHTVDYNEVGLKAGDFGYPAGFTERQVNRWSEQISWAREVTESARDVPELDQIYDWLAANVPEAHPHTLVHGDYKLDNVMYAPGMPPEINAIFDWELSTLGDPLTDVGWMLSFWFDDGDPDPPDSVGPLYGDITRRDGYSTRSELVERYESATGFTFEHERFYRALGVYKLAALGEMFLRRHLEGNADDPLYPEMYEGVPQLADRALRIIEGEEQL